MALLGAGALVRSRISRQPVFVLVVLGGACALGALSIGHEYTGGDAAVAARAAGRPRPRARSEDRGPRGDAGRALSARLRGAAV